MLLPDGSKKRAWSLSAEVPSPITEGDCQLSFGHFFVAFAEQAEELCLKCGLQQTVILRLVKDEEVVLSRTAGSKCVQIVDTEMKIDIP